MAQECTVRRDLPTEVLEMLARRQHVDSKDYRGTTALLRAAERGRADVVEALAELGADVNVRSDFGNRTPLHYACAGGHLTAIEVLLTHGATPEAQDNGRNTPFKLATAAGHQAAVQMLREYADKPVVVTICISCDTWGACTLRCIGMGGSELDSLSIDPERELLGQIRGELAKRLQVDTKLQLLLENGTLLEEADNVRTLCDVFGVSPAALVHRSEAVH